jgi:hypothetical protein
MFLENASITLPFEYWTSALLLAAAVILSVRQHHLPWIPPFVAAVGTVIAWYLVEPIYYGEFDTIFSETTVADGYRSLLIFVVAFFFATPIAVSSLIPSNRRTTVSDIAVDPDDLVPGLVFFWLFLLATGIYTVDGDVLGALFPLEGRLGATMWGRAAAEDAGPTGFLMSTATYLYTLVLSVFGLLLPLSR